MLIPFIQQMPAKHLLRADPGVQRGASQQRPCPPGAEECVLRANIKCHHHTLVLA